MDNRTEASDFLKSRRARLTPDQVGLPQFGARRRVDGLRREEVATLAGVSVDYYNRMERGGLSGVSESVLSAVADALRLDESERAHLFDLAHTANTGSRPRRRSPRPRVRQTVQQILDGMTNVPAYVRNGRCDVLAFNALGAALLPELLESDKPNVARYLLLDPRSQAFYADWEAVARDCVAMLRVEAGKDPYDRALTDLIGELATRSGAFRTWWATHDVRLHTSATKVLRHPVVGDIQVSGEAMLLPADAGLTVIAYTVEPASPSAEALGLLASWAASGRNAVSATQPSEGR